MNLKDIWDKFTVFLDELLEGDYSKTMQETEPKEILPPVESVQTPTPPPDPAPVSKLMTFCLAIQSREGWYGPGQLAGHPNGTRSYINNNPGNDKWVGGAPYPLGATGVDSDGFLIFKTYADGFDYLCNATTNICKADVSAANAYQEAAKAKGLHDCSYLTISQYFVIRDPSTDNNDPVSYASEVAEKVGVTVSTMMRQLLS